jgi:hypothetical protein
MMIAYGIDAADAAADDENDADITVELNREASI